METKTKTQNYQLKGNAVIESPILGNLIYDELGQEVLSIHNERFRGVNRIEDTHDYRKDQPISFSNTPRALSYNQILREILPDTHVLSPKEVVRFWDSIPERGETYADTDSVVIYPKEGHNGDLRTRVLDILGEDPKKLRVPMIVSGLSVEKADNDHGFTFVETGYTKSKKAPFLKEDGKVKYDASKGLVSSEEGIPVWVVNSGLRWLCRGGSDGLNCRYGNLLGSDDSGRVQILQEPKARAENLESQVNQLRAEKEKKEAELETRYTQALRFLRTGKL